MSGESESVLIPGLRVSSTEPAPLCALGRVSTLPERYGVDMLWISRVTDAATNAGRSHLCGIQRKQFPGDFLGSVDDGRLAKELGQARALDVAVLILEGKPVFTLDGHLLVDWGQSWTRDQLNACLWSVQAAGMWVQWTDDHASTIRTIRHLVEWTRKGKHLTARRRPAARAIWGTPTSREYQLHLLQGLPDIGPELADRILGHFDGLPWRWRDGAREELLTIHGLGPKKVDRIMKSLEKMEDDMDNDTGGDDAG